MKNCIFKMIKLIFLILFLSPFFITHAQAEIRQSSGETLYISVYPKTMSADAKKTKFYMTNILTVRNLDLLHSITVESITYHDASGAAKRQMLKEPVVLNALSSYTLRVEGEDLESPGMAGCYILSWKAAQEVNAPLAEMLIGWGRSGYTLSFVFQGVPIKN